MSGNSKTRTRLYTRPGIKTHTEAEQVRNELVAQGKVKNQPIDKVKIIYRANRNVFDVVAFGPQRESKEETHQDEQESEE